MRSREWGRRREQNGPAGGLVNLDPLRSRVARPAEEPQVLHARVRTLPVAAGLPCFIACSDRAEAFRLFRLVDKCVLTTRRAPSLPVATHDEAWDPCLAGRGRVDASDAGLSVIKSIKVPPDRAWVFATISLLPGPPETARMGARWGDRCLRHEKVPSACLPEHRRAYWPGGAFGRQWPESRTESTDEGGSLPAARRPEGWCLPATKADGRDSTKSGRSGQRRGGAVEAGEDLEPHGRRADPLPDQRGHEAQGPRDPSGPGRGSTGKESTVGAGEPVVRSAPPEGAFRSAPTGEARSSPPESMWDPTWPEPGPDRRRGRCHASTPDRGGTMCPGRSKGRSRRRSGISARRETSRRSSSSGGRSPT